MPLTQLKQTKLGNMDPRTLRNFLREQMAQMEVLDLKVKKDKVEQMAQMDQMVIKDKKVK